MQQVDKIGLKKATYAVSVNNNDELIIAYPSSVHRMDTKGNILDKQEDSNAETYQKLNNQSKIVTASSGDKYQKISEFGWTRIIKNGTEEVYRISTLSFIVKLLLYAVSASLFVNGAWLVYHIRNIQ